MKIHVPWLFDGFRWLPHASVEWQGSLIQNVESSQPESQGTFKNHILVPGLINLHSHLELSALRGLLPRRVPFPQWVSALQAHTKNWTADDFQDSVQAGLKACMASGTTSIFDVGNSGATEKWIETPGIRLFPHMELLGLNPTGSAERFERVRSQCSALCAHAPYSCAPELVKNIVQDCQRRNIPFTMHLAESLLEAELYSTGRGALRDWINGFYAEHSFQGPRGNAWQVAQELGLPKRSILAHGNTLSRQEMEAMASHGCTLVHCPQSAQWFGHPELNLQECKDAGLPVALGTDSLASAESLSLWDHMQCLWNRDGSLTCANLLSMATGIPGMALDAEAKLGQIRAGAWADFLLLECEGDSNPCAGEWLRNGKFRIITKVVSGQTIDSIGDVLCQKSC